MSENQLITFDDEVPNKNALVAASASGYLGRVKLCQAQAEEVQMGIVPKGGHFVYETDSGKKDAGSAFQTMVIDSRAKAIDFSGEEVVISYDPSEPAFQKIAQNCAFGSNRMAGPEHLLYLPQFEEFAYFYCYNPTLKAISDKLAASVGKALEISSFFFKGSKNSWYKVKVDVTTAFKVPDMEALKAVRTKFRDEQKAVELAPESERER